MTISTEDITLLPSVRTISRQTGRLYYYQGNFFQPIDPHGSEVGKIKRAIRQFTKTHAELIRKDRAASNYRTLVQLMEVSQCP